VQKRCAIQRRRSIRKKNKIMKKIMFLLFFLVVFSSFVFAVPPFVKMSNATLSSSSMALEYENCTGADYVYGIYANGSLVCSAPGGGGGSTWNVSGTNVFLYNSAYYVGIGTENPGDTASLNVTGLIDAWGLTINGSPISGTAYNDNWINSTITNEISGNGNWSFDKPSYYASTIIDGILDTIGNWTKDVHNYYNKTEVDSLGNYSSEKGDSGNWSADSGHYYTDTNAYNKTEVDSLGNFTLNFSRMKQDCPGGNYSYGFYSNGTIKCRDDVAGATSNLDNNTIIRVWNTSWINQSGLILNWSNIINTTGYCDIYSYTGTNLTGMSSSHNRILETSNNISTNYLVIVDSFLMQYNVGYTFSENNITFINPIWDDMNIELRDCAGGTGSSGAYLDDISSNINMNQYNITNVTAIYYPNSSKVNVWRTYVNSSGSLITEKI